MKPKSLKLSTDETIRNDQIEIVFTQTTSTISYSLAAAIVLIIALWNVVDTQILLNWGAILLLFSTARVILAKSYRRSNPTTRNMILWERLVVSSLIGISLIWGIGCWAFLPADSFEHQMFIFIFIMGLTGASAAAYSSHAFCVKTMILCFMTPVSITFAISENSLLQAVSLAATIYIAVTFRATTLLNHFLRKSYQLSFDLNIAKEHAEKMALTDVLTGINNRRAFYKLGNKVIQNSQRYQHAMSIVMLDIDKFKEINDKWGHAAGDNAIITLAKTIKAAAREADICGRLGGDEFSIILPETDTEQAQNFAERLCIKISNIVVATQTSNIAFTSSIGVATRYAECSKLEQLIACADAALYEAKNKGRNQVVVFDNTSDINKVLEQAIKQNNISADHSTDGNKEKTETSTDPKVIT